MNEIQIFKNKDFGEVRTLIKNGEPWFVGKDIAEILGYSNTKDALATHVEAEDKEVIQRSGNATLEIPNRGLTIINESGLYSLILSSKLPTAKKFKHWITAEVLPAIRKHGAYMTEQTIEQALINPDFLIRLASQLKEEQTKRKELEVEKQVNAPKIEFYDAVAGSKDAIEMQYVAKVLSIKGMGRNNLFEFLRNKGILDRNNIPYQRYIDQGYFRTIEQKWHTPTGETKINIKTLVYQKGIDFIRKLIKEDKKQ